MSSAPPPTGDLSVEAGTAEATLTIAARFGASLAAGDMVSLDGQLGAGKTVFVRGLARGRGLDPLQVRSPTFVFHHVYGAPVLLHHIDLYRLGGAARLGFLDIDGLIESAPVAVEWGELADLSPWQPLRLLIEAGPGGTRKIRLGAAGSAPARLVDAWRAAIRR